MLPLYGGPVQSLMGELRSHKLCEVDYRILKKEERKTYFFRRHSVHSISFPKCSNSINLIQNFCHWQWKIVNIRIIHLYFSSHVQCKSRAVRDAESTYLNQRAFWLIALDVCANFSSEKCTGKWERRKQSCFGATLFPEYPRMCSPLSPSFLCDCSGLGAKVWPADCEQMWCVPSLDQGSLELGCLLPFSVPYCGDWRWKTTEVQDDLDGTSCL